MKMKNKIICFVLAVITLVSVAVSPVYANQNLFEKYKDVYINGYKVPSTKDFMDAFLMFGKLYEKISGMKIFTDEKISVVLEGFLVDVYNDVYTFSDGTMDFDLFFKTLPISSAPVKKFYEITKLDKNDVVNYLNQKRIEAEENDDPMSLVYFFLRVYMNIFDEVIIGAYPINEEEGIYEVLVKVKYTDGTIDEMEPGIYYDAKRNYLYNSDSKGVLELGYDLDVNNATLLCVVDSWQRNFGFCLFYDVFSYLTPFFDYNTKRFMFDYDGREWMIQVWKGRYLITTGAEIGVYTRDEGSKGSFYNCASNEDMLKMSMTLYHGDTEILNVPETTHWWLTAFKFTPKCYLPESLFMNAEITLKDDEMTQAFVNSVSKHKDVKYDVDGNKVIFSWQ